MKYSIRFFLIVVATTFAIIPTLASAEKIPMTAWIHDPVIASVDEKKANWQVIGTVRNLFDINPPIMGDSVGSQTANRFFNTLPAAGYDLRGRSFILQGSMGFGGN